MKLKNPIIVAIALAAVYGLTSCDKAHDEHAGHDHDEHAEHEHEEGEDHDDHDHEGHDHDDHEGHDHGDIVAGPNGGRVLTSIEPHAEFFVTDDRKVQIAFVDDDLKPVSAADQSITVIAGDRSNPTQLAFTKSGDVLVSDKTLPDGNDFPVVVQIKLAQVRAGVR